MDIWSPLRYWEGKMIINESLLCGFLASLKFILMIYPEVEVD